MKQDAPFCSGRPSHTLHRKDCEDAMATAQIFLNFDELAFYKGFSIVNSYLNKSVLYKLIDKTPFRVTLL